MKFFIALFICFISFINLYGQSDVFTKASPLDSVIIINEQNNHTTYVSFKGDSSYVFSYKFDKEFGDVTLPDSLMNGQWIAYFKDDTSKIALCAEYKKHKPYKVKVYFFNGNLKQMYFLKDNLINGTCILYWPDGKIYANIKYKNGKLLPDKGIMWDEKGERIMYRPHKEQK